MRELRRFQKNTNLIEERIKLKVTKQLVATGIVLKMQHTFDRVVLLVDHARLGSWFFPGGHVDEGEAPDDTVVREVFEETGIKVRFKNKIPHGLSTGGVIQLQQPHYVLLEPVGNVGARDFHQHIDMIYLCYAIDDSPVIINPRESNGGGFFTFEETGNLAMIPNMRAMIARIFSDNSLWKELES